MIGTAFVEDCTCSLESKTTLLDLAVMGFWQLVSKFDHVWV
ncbi:hypothetical protein [Pseudoalteromonas denitrificans]|nr:hypothetical protein [Pseudoalteromonas denitrificans]